MSRNPFTPAFGTMPRVLAGRDDLLEGMREAFKNGIGDPYLSTILIGPRGSGKTVLLSRIREIATEEGWIAIGVTALPGMLEDLYEQACMKSEHLTEQDEGARLTSITVGPLSASWEKSSEKEGNWRTRMTRLLEQLDVYDTGLLITVDEATSGIDELIQLVAVFQHFVTEGRRISLVMAGLPYHVHRLVSNKSISFLRRSMQLDLERIPDADIEHALIETVEQGGKSISRTSAVTCISTIAGFPYMLQLVGYRIWAESDGRDEIDESAVNLGIQQALKSLDSNIHASTYRELSKGDVRFLTAMLPDTYESRMSDIAERMGVKYNYAANYKMRLLAHGVIAEPATGIVRMEIPGFRDYVKRMQGL